MMEAIAGASVAEMEAVAISVLMTLVFILLLPILRVCTAELKIALPV